LRDLGPAGHANLHKHQALAVSRELLPEPIERPQPLGNPFGVVDPVDPDADALAAQPELLALAEWAWQTVV
jgi:hypothetical protein